MSGHFVPVPLIIRGAPPQVDSWCLTHVGAA